LLARIYVIHAAGFLAWMTQKVGMTTTVEVPRENNICLKILNVIN